MGSESKQAQDQHNPVSRIWSLPAPLTLSPKCPSIGPLQPHCLLLGSQPGPLYCTGALFLGCRSSWAWGAGRHDPLVTQVSTHK